MTLYELEPRRKGSGFWYNGVAGETLGARKLVYMDTNGQWKLADANEATAFPVVGITMEAIPNGLMGRILLKGYVGDSNWLWADLGAPIYATNTPGELSQTPPLNKIQAVALAQESDLIYFDTGLNREVATWGSNQNNWEDLRFPATAVRLGGASSATFQSYKDGAVAAFSTITDQFVYIIAQMPHGWDQQTDIEPHIHWAIPVSGSGVGVENVKWDMTYSWSSIGGVIPNSTPLTLTRDVQNINADIQIYNSFGTISGTGFGASSCLIISLSRDTGVGNDYGNAAYLIEFDIHFKNERAGSTNIPSDTP